MSTNKINKTSVEVCRLEYCKPKIKKNNNNIPAENTRAFKISLRTAPKST